MTEDPTRIDIRTDPLTMRMCGVAAHGDKPFDVPFISHIEGNLWQGGCEDGMVLPEQFKHLVSLYPWEHYDVPGAMRSVLVVPMFDSTDQPFGRVDSIAAWVNACCDDAPTLVHCQAGLNRSALVAARALMLQGRSAEDAIALLRERRSDAVLCNPSFHRWLLDLDTGSDWDGIALDDR